MKKTLYAIASGCVAGLLAVLPTFGQAQLHVGLTSAFNTTLVLDKGLSEDPRYNATPTYNFSPVGVSVGADFGRGFGLQLESILSRQGQVYQIIDATRQVIGERRIELNYLHLPLLLRTFSTGSSRTRANFMFGPQLSLLTKGQEIYDQHQRGTLVLPEGEEPPAGATEYDPAKRTYVMPAQETTIYSTEAQNAVQQFRKMDLQLALGLGLDVDLGRNLYLSTQIRGNYGFVDVRNEDVINAIKNSTGKQFSNDLFGRRANVLVGAQIGLHWMFGGNRSSPGSSGGVRER
jgi:hypothetical protein